MGVTALKLWQRRRRWHGWDFALGIIELYFWLYNDGSDPYRLEAWYDHRYS
jgi:hypothetical protein